MIVGLISSIVGLISGLAPKVMDYFQDRVDKAHELDMTQLQIEMAKVQGQVQVQAIDQQAIADTIKGEMAQVMAVIEAQAKPSGNSRVDAFNAIIRPLTAFNIMCIFSVFAYLYAVELVIMIWHHDISAATAMDVFMGGAMGDVFQAVMGFLFGYRSVPAAKALLSKVG